MTSSLQQEAASVMGNMVFTVFEKHRHQSFNYMEQQIFTMYMYSRKHMQEITLAYTGEFKQAVCFYMPISVRLAAM